MTAASPIATNPSASRYGTLLGALLLIFVVFPLLKAGTLGNFLLGLVFMGVLVSALWAVGKNRWIVVAGLLPGLCMFADEKWLPLEHSPFLSVLSAVGMMIFVSVIIVTLAVDVHRASEVTLGTILGACSIYLLLGIFWYGLFAAMETLEPSSFSFGEQHAADVVPQIGAAGMEEELSSVVTRRQLFYYAFVTLTTLGYGDITPVSAPAQIYSTLAAVSGQLFIAILVARLVGAWAAGRVARTRG